MSPENEQLLTEDERLVVERLRAARARDRAPASLRARLEKDRARSPRRVPSAAPPRLGLAVLVVLLAVLVIVFAPKQSPTLAQTVALAGRAPTQPAPATEAGDPANLTAHVGTLHFPARLAALTATGVRTDHVRGRLAVTVYYGPQGRGLAYSIIASALPAPASYAIKQNGYYYLTVAHRTVVTWRDGGETCVISGGAEVSPRLLSSII